ncbi:MAG: DUF2851 family protein [candidate division KSB1 bacterium]|nr:DUF2851 family protein [candidate division KSB1 bacterium]
MKVQEPAAESFLHRLWEEQLAGRKLFTVDGRTVEILSPGTRNFDAGPDYRDAIVRLDGQLMHGDIEIHPSVGDWVRHGHDRDPAYNRVILHIVTAGCPEGAQTVRADGVRVPIVDLDRHLPRPAEELEGEPSRLTGKGKPPMVCALAQADPEQKLLVIEQASVQRLEYKAERFREERQYADWEEVAYRGLLEALGYAKNQIPARALAERLPVHDLRHFSQRLPDPEAVVHVQAWLLGASGLLEAAPGASEPAVAEFVRLQRSLWEGYPNRRKVDSLAAADWRFFRLRPANFPTRRLAAMAVLIVRHRLEGFVGSWARLLEATSHMPARLPRELEKTLVVPAFGFWEQRDCFLTGKRLREGSAPLLLGRDRARDIVVNVVLPLLCAYAEESGDGALRAVAERTYRTYPRLPENEILRAMRARLWEELCEARQAVRTAAQQQGLIHLYKFGCRLGDCSFCQALI